MKTNHVMPYNSAKGGEKRLGSSHLIQADLSRNGYGATGLQAMSQMQNPHHSSLLEGGTIPSVFSQVQIVQNMNNRNASQSAH